MPYSMRICMRHSMGHSIPHGMRNGVRSLRIPLNGMRMACAKVSRIACDIRPPQQPLKHQTKAPHGIRNHGIRQGIRKACAKAYAMAYDILWYLYTYTPRIYLGDAPIRTFIKIYYSGPGRSLALIIITKDRYR